jgi:hypothetical protein
VNTVRRVMEGAGYRPPKVERKVHELGYALLIDPHAVVSQLRRDRGGQFPDQWWTAFEARCSKAGIALSGAHAQVTPPPDGEHDAF